MSCKGFLFRTNISNPIYYSYDFKKQMTSYRHFPRPKVSTEKEIIIFG
jgi:hypothetical protein